MLLPTAGSDICSTFPPVPFPPLLLPASLHGRVQSSILGLGPAPQVPTHTGAVPELPGRTCCARWKGSASQYISKEKKKPWTEGTTRRAKSTSSFNHCFYRCLGEKQTASAATRSHLERQEMGKHAPWLGPGCQFLFAFFQQIYYSASSPNLYNLYHFFSTSALSSPQILTATHQVVQAQFCKITKFWGVGRAASATAANSPNPTPYW